MQPADTLPLHNLFTAYMCLTNLDIDLRTIFHCSK
jgi:hypothetical protein